MSTFSWKGELDLRYLTEYNAMVLSKAKQVSLSSSWSCPSKWSKSLKFSLNNNSWKNVYKKRSKNGISGTSNTWVEFLKFFVRLVIT